MNAGAPGKDFWWIGLIAIDSTVEDLLDRLENVAVFGCALL
jgi:hypothetical protein